MSERATPSSLIENLSLNSDSPLMQLETNPIRVQSLIERTLAVSTPDSGSSEDPNYSTNKAIPSVAGQAIETDEDGSYMTTPV